MTTELEQQEQDLIPPAVRRRIEEMSKFTTPDPVAEPKDEAPPATPAEPEAAPAAVTPETKAEESPPPPAEPTTFAEVATEEMTKEQRYKIMEGMQKSIGRELRQARADAQALRDEVQALKAQSVARPAAPVSASADKTAEPDDEELNEAFGEKNLTSLEERMMRRLRARGFVVTQDLQQVQQQVGQVTQSLVSSEQDKFEADMDGYTEGRWKATNLDPRFKAYLAEPEGRSGMTRQQLAENYLQARNAPMLAQFFVDFDAEAGVPPAAPLKAPAFDKKKFVAPRATATAAAPLSEDKPMVKTSDFTKLEADMRAGKYSSDDPEKHKVLSAKFAAEQERLNEAQRTGRVIRG